MANNRVYQAALQWRWGVDHSDVAPDIVFGQSPWRRCHAVLCFRVNTGDLGVSGTQSGHPLDDIWRQPARLCGKPLRRVGVGRDRGFPVARVACPTFDRQSVDNGNFAVTRLMSPWALASGDHTIDGLRSEMNAGKRFCGETQCEV